MNLQMTQMSEVVRHFTAHLGLSEYLRKDPADSILWVEQSQYPQVIYWSLLFGVRLDPANPSQTEQVASFFSTLSDKLQNSQWFKERENTWKKQNEKLIASLKASHEKIRELEKYETHYKMQLKMIHGEVE